MNVLVDSLFITTSKVIEQKKVEEYAQELDKTGLCNPLVVYRNGEVIDGVYRLLALRQLKARRVDVIVVSEKWLNFGYETKTLCIICDAKGCKIEPRFGYAICMLHFEIPPSVIHK